MNSLENYYWYKKKFAHPSVLISTKENAMNKLIKQIYEEITNPLPNLNKSPFIAEVEKSLEYKTFKYSIYIQDACIIIEGLTEYIKNPEFTSKKCSSESVLYLFIDMKLREMMIMDYTQRIVRCLNFLRAEFQSTKIVRNEKKTYMPEAKNVQEHQLASSLSEKGRFPTSVEKQIYQLPDTLVETEVASDTTEAQTHQLPNPLIEKNKASDAAETPPDAPAKEKITFDTIEEQRLKTQEKRIEQNRIHVQLWHDEQAGISANLLEMQPHVKQILENLMSFSDNITDQYVLQFSKMQIDLFNQIYDAHIYHEKNINGCKDQAYVNAVLNYGDFMESIVDNLAVFGIEEIVSDSGTHFDGAIHEANTDSFSPKTAMITKSVRPGFKYKDLIIQKEKVLI